MKYLLLPLMLIALEGLAQKKYRLPAEWETHQAVWVNHRGFDRDTVVDKMVLALHKDVVVIVRSSSDSVADILTNRYREAGADLNRIGFITMSEIKRVVRDRGPIFLKDQFDSLKIMDFNFHWSYPYRYEIYEGERNYSRDIGKLFNIPVISTELIHEGGALEINQSGTLIQVEKIMHHRNPKTGKKELEEFFSDYLGVKQTIWLWEGLASDPLGLRIVNNSYALGVGGHIDEFARFANDTTIFIHFVDDEEKGIDTVMSISETRMNKNIDILKSSERMDGEKFNIEKIPIPYYPPRKYVMEDVNIPYPFDIITEKYPQLKTGDTLLLYPTVSYLNYLVTNNFILLPKYGDDPLKHFEGTPEEREEILLRLQYLDKYALKLFQRYFPSRKVIQINPIGLNWYGGGIHCWSQQMPVGKF